MFLRPTLLSFAASILLVVPRAALGQEVILPADRADFHLFLLIGQSNMAGRGTVEPEDQVPHERVLKLNQADRWVPATDPLHFDKPSVVGVGLGRTFALDYAQRHRAVTVGLIPCAAGGSPIAAWEPGGYHDQTKSHPYDDALRRAKLALQSGTLRGILWHQGESDSTSARSPVYQQKLHALIARLRRELDAPDVPFIVGQLGQFPERPWNEPRKEIDRALQALPTQVARTAFVPSDGLEHKGDQVHFNAASYRELGHRYFQAYLTVTGERPANALQFALERLTVQHGFSDALCWVHARAGTIPPHTTVNPGSQPCVVLTAQQLQLTGSDVFFGLHGWTTCDRGRSWTGPTRYESFGRQRNEAGQELTVCDFTPKWHAGTSTLLGTGHTVWYEDNRVMPVRPRATAYAVYRPNENRWSPWQRLQLPDEPRFQNAGAGSVQRLDLANGDILLPFYFKAPDATQYSVTVCRCTFDGQTMTYREHGNEMTVPVKRGFAEPSLTRFQDNYYLTLRNDEHGYVTSSPDGLHFGQPKRWTFDDGKDLGNYNTQQHWVTHSDGLFLVYTRRGADNDHVFRHRAPLFIAHVDPQQLCVIRSTEQVLVPERVRGWAILESSTSRRTRPGSQWPNGCSQLE